MSARRSLQPRKANALSLFRNDIGTLKMKKLRITPLNIASAALLVIAVYIFIKGITVAGSKTIHLGTAMGLIFILFAFVVSFLDVMLRNFFPETKKLWLIEISFITLVAVILLLVK
jgi:hypothetical protein